MTDDEICVRVLTACDLVLDRREDSGIKGSEEINRQLIVEYLSGASQAVEFLMANDGAVTAGQLQRGLILAGQQLGLSRERPRKKGKR